MSRGRRASWRYDFTFVWAENPPPEKESCDYWTSLQMSLTHMHLFQMLSDPSGRQNDKGFNIIHQNASSLQGRRLSDGCWNPSWRVFSSQQWGITRQMLARNLETKCFHEVQSQGIDGGREKKAKSKTDGPVKVKEQFGQRSRISDLVSLRQNWGCKYPCVRLNFVNLTHPEKGNLMRNCLCVIDLWSCLVHFLNC